MSIEKEADPLGVPSARYVNCLYCGKGGFDPL